MSESSESNNNMTYETSVAWTFTSYADTAPVLHPKIKCMIFQRERCPSTARLHWQGAFRVYNKNGIQLKTARKYLPDAHLIISKGSWAQNVKYCSKPESQVSAPVILGSPPLPSNVQEQSGPKVDKLKELHDLILKGMTKRQVLSSPEYIGVYSRNRNAIEDLFKMCAIKPPASIRQLSEFNHPPLDLSKTCVLLGPSNIGKTGFAIAHFKRPFIVTDADDLANFDAQDYDGIVFDDCNFTHWPRTAQIHLVDMDYQRSIRIRYATAVIPAHTKKIITCNIYPLIDDEAINRRVNLVNVESLYDLDEPAVSIESSPEKPSSWEQTVYPLILEQDSKRPSSSVVTNDNTEDDFRRNGGRLVVPPPAPPRKRKDVYGTINHNAESSEWREKNAGLLKKMKFPLNNQISFESKQFQ